MINAVLFIIPTYFLSFFRLPRWVESRLIPLEEIHLEWDSERREGLLPGKLEEGLQEVGIWGLRNQPPGF